MNTQMLTAVIAALGLAANFAGIGQARAAVLQDGHTQHAHAVFHSDRMTVAVEGPAPGLGRDIILIPGLSSSPEIWQGTVDHLGAGWRVHRIHINGFAGAPVAGNTQGPVGAPVAEEIARYIAEAHLNKPVVVGHSMGGTIGMMLAARHPEAVGRLMVVDMIPFMGVMLSGAGATSQSVAPIADQVAASMADATPPEYQARAAAAVTGMIKTEAKRAGPLQDTASTDQQIAARSMRELFVTDLRAELPKITAPTEVLYVKFADPMTNEITDGIYQASFATLPGATLKRIDDSAHFIMLDQPAVFYADLDAFVSAK